MDRPKTTLRIPAALAVTVLGATLGACASERPAADAATDLGPACSPPPPDGAVCLRRCLYPTRTGLEAAPCELHCERPTGRLARCYETDGAVAFCNAEVLDGGVEAIC